MAWLCFYLQAAISSRGQRTGLRNPIKMTDYILSLRDLSLGEDLQVQPGNVEKGTNMKNYIPGMICVLLKVVRTRNSPALLMQNKINRHLIRITADTVS